ncbi:MAG: hypothetical protein B7Y74_09270, partial [Novosphingobium sp. 35-62-5]
MKTNHGLFLVGCSALALAGCGPTDISSPGTGGNVVINPPAPAPTPAPTPTPTSSGVVAAAGCPNIGGSSTFLGDSGIVTSSQGSWRVCTLPARISTSVTLPKIAGLLYSMNGRVDVGTDAGFSSTGTNVTLTIEPGVVVFGNTGTSWLAVNRGNKINAVGTATQPIIFTSRDNVLGLNGETSQGQWGGVVLMGRAPITDCTTGAVASGGTASTCERQTEGAADPALYGGTNSADSSGVMKYVQIRYSGFVLGSNSELQALTLEGTGSGTELDYIQSYNSSDDGAEFFGGTVNMKHYIAVGADDDSLDMDTGVQANLQYLLLIQRAGAGDGLMELDSNGNEAQTPRQVSRMSNVTAIQTATSSNNEANAQASLFFRGNSDISLYNSVIYTPNNQCIRMNGSGGSASATLTARSVVMTCSGTGDASFIGSGAYTASQVAGFFGSGSNGNNAAFTSSLTGGFINGANETAVTPFDVTSLSSFF